MNRSGGSTLLRHWPHWANGVSFRVAQKFSRDDVGLS